MKRAFKTIGAALFVTALVASAFADPKPKTPTPAPAPKPVPTPITVVPVFSCTVSNVHYVDPFTVGKMTITKTGGGPLARDGHVIAKIKGPKVTTQNTTCTKEFTGTPQRFTKTLPVEAAPADWIYTCTASIGPGKCPVTPPPT